MNYNYLRDHMSLGKTPAEEAKIDYPFKSWSDITRIVHPQTKILITPAKVAVINNDRMPNSQSPRITPKMSKISPTMRKLK